METAPTNPQRRIKILCLHGYEQSGELFSVKLRALRERMNDFADFYFPNGPINLTHVNNSTSATESVRLQNTETLCSNFYGWWLISTFYDDVLEPKLAWKHLSAYMQEHGPFDGLITFSQGTNLGFNLASLVTIPKYQEYFNQKPFMFAVFCSGYCRPLAIDGFCTSMTLEIPTLHLIGKYDTVLPTASSERLIRACKGAHVIMHSASHEIPAPQAYVDPVAAFIYFFSRKKWPRINKNISLIVPSLGSAGAGRSANDSVERQLLGRIVTHTNRAKVNALITNVETYLKFRDVLGANVLCVIVSSLPKIDEYRQLIAGTSAHIVGSFEDALVFLQTQESIVSRIHIMGDCRLLTLGMLFRCTKRIITVTDEEGCLSSRFAACKLSHSLPLLEHSSEWSKISNASQIKQWTGQSRVKHKCVRNTGESVITKLQMWERQP
ncbi:serine hydrolase [Schizosaccharomyces japonicus yFS275]|uniref:Serine hydrolase n=1 Tax=Schizosaccharomyces japonicus (strain yFS275 / FY16936) TaxID=402676 RepID=B6K2W1_SCHJY|nr:serine hydrolase [Schizosaccharomyces japonicus yFS275]EEB08601.1 serine hydrolase [Schizosaccharomyces japonicus yFS275]